MAKLKLKLFTILFLLLTLGLSINSFAAEDKILCVVGDDVITQKDLNEFLAMVSIQLSAQIPNKKELAKRMQEIKKDVLDQMVEEKMIIQEAKRQKLKVDEARVSERLQDIIRQYASAEEFEQALISEGLTLNDAKNKIRQQLLMVEAINENVRSKIFIHPKEVTDYFKEHSREFALPESARVDSIFCAGEDNLSAAQEKINSAMNALKNGEDFEAVSQKYSDGPSLGLVRRGQLKKNIEDVIFKLNPGSFSQPVRTEKGYFIFKLKELIPAQERPLSSVQNEVYQAVFQEKFQARFKEWLDTIKKDVYCVIK